MAGDWIKVEKSTSRKPEVLAIAESMGIHPDHALGLCVRFWSWCDDNMSRSCHALVTSLSSINHAVGRDNFAESLASVGWVMSIDGQITIPNFDRHLSQTAKTRSLATDRKRDERSRNCHDGNVTKTRPEKRREEKSTIPPNPQGGIEDVDSETDTTPKPKTILPAGWEKMNPTTRKQTRVNLNSPTMNRIGKMLGRREGTLWTVAEAVALKTVNPNADEIELMETYYLVEIPKGEDYRRRDLITLLNNWNGELDRARTNQPQ